MHALAIELEFVKPGTEVFDLYAMYSIGWHYNEDKTVNLSKIPIEFKQHPLGETSSSTLGLNYVETKPKVSIVISLPRIAVNPHRKTAK